MLKGLDEIDWARSSTRRRARTFPGSLEISAPAGSKRRQRALWELFGNIHHQRTVYRDGA